MKLFNDGTSLVGCNLLLVIVHPGAFALVLKMIKPSCLKSSSDKNGEASTVGLPSCIFKFGFLLFRC